jgi:hypothetical protein
MIDDEIEKIKADMELQGFPLEVKTSRILEAHGWEVTNQTSYLDAESGKNRTLDVIAEKNVILNSKWGFDIWLCVECKKVTKPWVFYSTNFDLTKEELRRKVVSSTHFSMNKLAQKRGNFNRFANLVLGHFLLKSRYPQSIFNKLAHNSFEPFTDGKNRSIHKARMQVCNMVLYLETSASIDTLSMINSPYFLLYVPVIVVDGNLYVYENDQLNSVDGLYYHVPYYHASFIIEIVTAKTFEKYLDNLEQLMVNFKTQSHENKIIVSCQGDMKG